MADITRISRWEESFPEQVFTHHSLDSMASTLAQYLETRKELSWKGLYVDSGFYVAESACYGIDARGHVILYITNYANNPLVKKPIRGQVGLLKDRRFFLDPKEASELESKVGAGVDAFDLTEMETAGNLTTNKDDKYVKVRGFEFGDIEIEVKHGRGGRRIGDSYGQDVAALVERTYGAAVGEACELLGMRLPGNKIAIGIIHPRSIPEMLKGKEGSLLVYGTTLGSEEGKFFVSLASINIDLIRRAFGEKKSVEEIAAVYSSDVLPFGIALTLLKPIVASDSHNRLEYILQKRIYHHTHIDNGFGNSEVTMVTPTRALPREDAFAVLEELVPQEITHRLGEVLEGIYTPNRVG